MTDINIYRADNKIVTAIIRDENNALVNVSGQKSYLTVKNNLSLADANATFQINGSISGNVTGGTLLFYITPTNTSGAVPGQYKYDIQVTDSNSRVFTAGFGDFNILQDVTKTGS